MVCQKCNSPVAEGAAFCSMCGEKISMQEIENQIKHCSACGEVIKEGNKFCAKCGTSVHAELHLPAENVAKSVFTQKSSGKIKGSYFFSVASAILSLIIRLFTQDIYYSWQNLLDNKKVLGIDSDAKPFLTFIPVVAAVIASLMIVSDKKVSSQKKITALITNAIFIALGLLFIWLDIPYSIIDF